MAFVNIYSKIEIVGDDVVKIVINDATNGTIVHANFRIAPHDATTVSLLCWVNNQRCPCGQFRLKISIINMQTTLVTVILEQRNSYNAGYDAAACLKKIVDRFRESVEA